MRYSEFFALVRRPGLGSFFSRRRRHCAAASEARVRQETALWLLRYVAGLPMFVRTVVARFSTSHEGSRSQVLTSLVCPLTLSFVLLTNDKR